jgi:chromosomal replication initiation ATPase DnaA
MSDRPIHLVMASVAGSYSADYRHFLRSRRMPWLLARHHAMAIAAEIVPHVCKSDIARAFNRDDSSVFNAIKTIERRRETDLSFPSWDATCRGAARLALEMDKRHGG